MIRRVVFLLLLGSAACADSGSSSITFVNPEDPVVVSTTVPTGTPPPFQVRLPEVISDSRQWRGVQCGVTEARQALFRHADKWESFWTRGVAPYSPRLAKVPGVDFSKDMVVGVFLGEKKYPYYEVKIRSVKVETDPEGRKILMVRYREIHKMSGVFRPEFPIQPFHLLRVPIFDGPIRFEKA